MPLVPKRTTFFTSFELLTKIVYRWGYKPLSWQQHCGCKPTFSRTNQLAVKIFPERSDAWQAYIDSSVSKKKASVWKCILISLQTNTWNFDRLPEMPCVYLLPVRSNEWLQQLEINIVENISGSRKRCKQKNFRSSEEVTMRTCIHHVLPAFRKWPVSRTIAPMCSSITWAEIGTPSSFITQNVKTWSR